MPGNRSVLEVDERQLPERYAPVLRRLAGAAASVEVADSMALEDEVSETWGRMKREIAADKRPWRRSGRIAKRPRSAQSRWRGGWQNSVASRAVP